MDGVVFAAPEHIRVALEANAFQVIQQRQWGLPDAEGLTLIAANTGEDVTAAMQADPMRKAMVQIQAVFAELDKNLLVRKLRKGRDAVRQATGRCEGPLPFGQDPARPGEAEVVQRFRELRAMRPRLSLQKIADALNTDPDKYPTRTGTKWSKQLVYSVLYLRTDA
jgi:hypothetical protein